MNEGRAWLPAGGGFPGPEAVMARLESLGRRRPATLDMRIAGRSRNGLAIPVVRAGEGKAKVLVVGFPHPNEPVGGALGLSCIERVAAGWDVRLDFVPALELDSALRNHWYDRPLSLEEYVQGSFLDAGDDQLEFSYPARGDAGFIRSEVATLAGILASAEPDVYLPAHSSPGLGGVYFYVSDGFEPLLLEEMGSIVRRHGLYLEHQPHAPQFDELCPGFYRLISTQNLPFRNLLAGRETSYRFFAQRYSGKVLVCEVPMAAGLFPPQDPCPVPPGEAAAAFNAEMDEARQLFWRCGEVLLNGKPDPLRRSVLFWGRWWGFPTVPAPRAWTWGQAARLEHAVFLRLTLLGWLLRLVAGAGGDDGRLARMIPVRMGALWDILRWIGGFRLLTCAEQVALYTDCLIAAARNAG
jgi:hypothetical protein